MGKKRRASKTFNINGAEQTFISIKKITNLFFTSQGQQHENRGDAVIKDESASFVCV